MYTITIYNHEFKSYGQTFSFETKRKGNAWLKSNDNIRKCGYDFHDLKNMSIEYIVNY